MPIKFKGGSRDGQVTNLAPIDDNNGRWIEFADTGQYYTSTREFDQEGNEIFVYKPEVTGPLTK